MNIAADPCPACGRPAVGRGAGCSRHSIPEELSRHPVLVQAMADLDLAGVIRFLRENTEMTQESLGLLMGVRHHRVSELENRRRQVWDIRVFKRAVQGLGIPCKVSGTSDRHESDSSAHSPDVLSRHPPPEAIGTSLFWEDDLQGKGEKQTELAAISLISRAFSWVVGPVDEGLAVPRKRSAQAEVIRSAASVFASLDNQVGGLGARRAAVQYLSDVVAPALREADGGTESSLSAAAAELVLTVAWMAYDSQEHGVARRYFLQALEFADHAGDRQFGASVLSAMSHQANYLGEHAEARDLARAAFHGSERSSTATMRAQFLMMEARASAAAGDRSATLRTMSQAESEFDRSQREADPEWIRYFDACEFSDELAHCFRDLDDPRHARRYAEQCLSLSDGDEYARSRAFSRTVLAAAVLGEGEVEEAAGLGTQVVPRIARTASARTRSYLADLVRRFDPHRDNPAVMDFLGQAVPLLRRGAS